MMKGLSSQKQTKGVITDRQYQKSLCLPALEKSTCYEKKQTYESMSKFRVIQETLWINTTPGKVNPESILFHLMSPTCILIFHIAEQ